MTPSNRTEPGVCTRCGDTRVIPIGDGYSVNPCPNCTMFHQQQPAQPLYDSLGRCINFRDVHPAQPGSGGVRPVRGRISAGCDTYIGESDDLWYSAEAYRRLQSALTAAKAYSDDLETRYHTAHERLTAAQQRIAELESELENERARGIHTCHDQCPRPLCVANRRIRELESGLSEAIEIMTRGERLLPKAEWVSALSPNPRR